MPPKSSAAGRSAARGCADTSPYRSLVSRRPCSPRCAAVDGRAGSFTVPARTVAVFDEPTVAPPTGADVAVTVTRPADVVPGSTAVSGPVLVTVRR